MVDLSIPEDWYQRPNIARIYDYWLDGTQHFPVDREVADRMDAAHPHIRTAVMSNRLFLRRAVSFLAGQGIEQFLDLGTGLPTGGNVHTTPGSYLAFSHLDFEALSDDSAEEARRIYEGSVTRIKPRTIAEVTELLKDFEMVEPGVVFIPAWRPLPAIQSDPYAKRPEQASMVGGIGRKVE
jgi:hypothetical protein